jgi:hypothetical protein
MRKKLGLALAALLVSAALGSGRVEAVNNQCMGCTTAETACIAACGTNYSCKFACTQAWVTCRCNSCNICE